ncbi:hypothetical protein [Streptomyces sp. NPDC091299]|uniref:hypothetical protein n=1 Tax=Streptomyces sp. NPDC091299 TaxID=3155302 RepID=UPI00342007BC
MRRKVWSSSLQVGRQGFSGVGALAAAVEVASGAVCSNFGSKEALLEKVVGTELGAEFADVVADPAERRAQRPQGVLAVYLSEQHRVGIADGCVMPSLSADPARAGDSVRDVYGRRMVDLFDVLAPPCPLRRGSGIGRCRRW